MLEKFYNNNVNLIQKVEKASQTNDDELVHRLIHTLKGVSGNLGMLELFETAKSVELGIKEKGIINIDSELKQIENILDPILESCKNVFKNNISDEIEFISIEEYFKEIKIIENMIIDYNPEAIDQLEKIKITNRIDIYEELKDNLQKYDFDSALEIIKDVIKSYENETST